MPAKKPSVKPKKTNKQALKSSSGGASSFQAATAQTKPTGRVSKIMHTRVRWYVIVAIILVPLLAYGTYVFIHNKQIENSRIERLKQSGIALDKVKAALDKSGIDAQTKRLTYCWRTGEKYGPGYRYCDQRLVVYGSNKTESQQLEGIHKVVESLGTVTDVKALSRQTAIFRHAVLFVGQEIKIGGFTSEYCAASVFAHTYDYGTDLAGKYSVDIKCSVPIESGDIYPKGENYDVENIFEGPY